MTQYGDVSVPFITISLLFSSAPLGQDSIWAVLRCVTCLTSANRNHRAVAKRGGALIGQFWLLKIGRKGCFSLFFCLQPISLLDMRNWSPVCVKPSSWLAVLVFWCKFLPLGRRVAAQRGEWCGFVFDGLALWMAYTTPLLVAELPEKLSCWVIVRSSPVERRGRPLGAPPRWESLYNTYFSMQGKTTKREILMSKVKGDTDILMN